MKLNLGISMLLLIGSILNSCEKPASDQNASLECSLSGIWLDYNISFKFFDENGRTRAPENIYYDLLIENHESDSMRVKEFFKMGLISDKDSISFRAINHQSEYLVKGQKSVSVFVYPFDKFDQLQISLRSEGINELASALAERKYFYESPYGNDILSTDSLIVNFNYTDTTFNINIFIPK